MRELKFRVYNRRLKQMSEPFTIEQLITSEVTLLHKTRFYEKIEWLQFTGLKDVNGKDIYEGDIIRHPLTNDSNIHYVGKVVWDESCARFAIIPAEWYKPDYAMWLSEGMKCEVIGDIYQNPALLEKVNGC